MVAWVLSLLGGAPAGAVVFYSTPSTTYNSTAPTGALTNSGWQFQGTWQIGRLGTPIAPNYFITAAHVGGSVGDVFSLNGTNFTTTAVTSDSNIDLAVWRVATPFTSWAPLYTQSDEVGRSLVVFGKGFGRESDVMMNGDLKGWQWNTNNRMRWGENVVSGTLNDSGHHLLYADFDADGGVNEAHLAHGDSGGGVFIQQDGTWALAGINFAVDGYFNTTNTGSGFNAAIFDAGGLYVGSSGNWTYIPDQQDDIPSSFYATRISQNLSWINSVIIPEPSAFWLVSAGGAALLSGRRRRVARGGHPGRCGARITP